MEWSYAKGNFRSDLESLYLEYYQKHFGKDGIGVYDEPWNEEKVTSIQLESLEKALELLLLTFCTPKLDNIVTHLPGNSSLKELAIKHHINNQSVESQEDTYDRAGLLGASYVLEGLKLAYIHRQFKGKLIAADELDSLARSIENTLVIVDESSLNISEKDYSEFGSLQPLLLESPKLILLKDGSISAHQSTIEFLQLVKRMNLSLGQSFEQAEHHAYETIPVGYKKPDGIKVHMYQVKGTYEETPEAMVIVIKGILPNGYDAEEHFHYLNKEIMSGLMLYQPSALILDCRQLRYKSEDAFVSIFESAQLYASQFKADNMDFPALICVSDLCQPATWSQLNKFQQELSTKHIFEDFDTCVEQAVLKARDWLEG